MDTRRARAETGWEPRHDAVAVVEELLDGFAAQASAPTPPLGPGRRRGVTQTAKPGAR